MTRNDTIKAGTTLTVRIDTYHRGARLCEVTLLEDLTGAGGALARYERGQDKGETTAIWRSEIVDA